MYTRKNGIFPKGVIALGKAYLLLEDGHVFEGESFGAEGETVGELVFTTGVVGYVETLSDPSYYGQIVMHTFPYLGDYGWIEEDMESEKSHMRGVVVIVEKAVGLVRTMMATYADRETMITAGIYQKGNSPEIDIAIDKHGAIEEFLKQEEYEPCPMADTLKKLSELTGIEIPEEEFVEAPAVGIPTTAQIVDESKNVIAST